MKEGIATFILFSLLLILSIFLQKFLSSTVIDNLKDKRNFVLDTIKEGRKIGFYEGVPESYLYYYYMRKRGKEVY